jgi:hypothetical protein
MPLDNFLSQLAQATDLPILLDKRALEDVSIATSLKIEVPLPPMTIGRALDVVLHPKELAWTVCDEVLVVTTPAIEQESIILKVYPVHDLVINHVPARERERVGDFLLALIEQKVLPKSWNRVGGNASAEFFVSSKAMMIVRHTYAGHVEIARLLASLRHEREAKTGDAAEAQPGGNKTVLGDVPNLAVVPEPVTAAFTVQSEAEQAAEERILAALAKPLGENLAEMPLSEFLARIERTHGLPATIDRRGLEDVALTSDVLVSCDTPKWSLRSVLRKILGANDLTWIIEDECLVITTPAIASEREIVRVYPVRDLISAAEPYTKKSVNFGQLEQLITDMVAPNSWPEIGGSYTFFHAESGTLVIPQMREVHEQIEPLLAALREARDAQRTVSDK